MNDIKILSNALKYYARKDVQEAIVREAEHREVGLMLITGQYLNRPEILTNSLEVLEYAKKKVVSFHFSEELWEDPLKIGKQEADSLRIGWDFIIDVDSVNFEISKIAAEQYMKLLDNYELNFGLKFSGNKGFHIAIPFEALPSEIHSTKINQLFPEAARKVATYIDTITRKKISNKIVEKFSIDELIKETNKKYDELVKNGELNLPSIVSLDTQLVSSRHLFRAPYSLNEKSGLVSLPLKKSNFLKFQREDAKPELVETELYFIDRKNVFKNSAKSLFMNAYDYFANEIELEKQEIKKIKKQEIEINPQQSAKMKEKIFSSEPPCIRIIKNGLSDGKKRALFIYLNYLHSLNFETSEIEKIIYEWNKKNNPPLKETYIKGQLRYFLSRNPVLPPNCDKEGFYKDIGICKPDKLCEKIKNPLNYTINLIRRKIDLEENKSKRGKKDVN
ncbi:MAG: hypothetical protein QXR30_01055 [Candidatus Woesearchaeota archaeon]